MSQPSSMTGWTWVVTAPVLLLPWVLVKFTAWLFIWVVLLTWRTLLMLWALRFVPIIFIVIWGFGAPLQQSQKTFIDVGFTVTRCTDFLWNSGLKLVLQDLIWCMRPLCDLYNLVAETFIILFRLLWDQIEDLIGDIFKKKREEREARQREQQQQSAKDEERFIFNGLPPDTPPPAFGIIEDICDVINDIIDVLIDVVLLVIGTVVEFVDDILLDGLGDPFKIIGELLNFLLTELLGIPCLDFANGLGGFVAALLDCINLGELGDCVDGSNNSTDFLDCLDDFLPFKKKRKRFTEEDQEPDIPGYTGGASKHDLKKPRTLAQSWEHFSDRVGMRWTNSDVLPFSRGGGGVKLGKPPPIHRVGHSSPPVYQTPAPDDPSITYSQRMWIGFSTVIRNLLIVFSSTHLDSESFRISSMPYREKLRALRAMNTGGAVRDLLTSFREHARERAESRAVPAIVANVHTMASTVVTRLLAPHRVNATLEAFKKRGPEYASAVKHVVSRLGALEGNQARAEHILTGRIRRRAVYKFRPRDYSVPLEERATQRRRKNNPLRGTIWDITDYLEYTGSADPDAHVRQEMEALGRSWTKNANVTAWRERARSEAARDLERGHQDYYSTVPEEGLGFDHKTAIVRSVGAASAHEQSRIPFAAIALVFLKNPRFIVAAIVPFVTSKPGQVVIRRYLTLLNPIFGKYFSSGLADLNAGDLLDLAEEFTDITIDNLFYLTNVFLQFIFCSYWAFILRGAAFILSFIPVIGFLFSTAANWALAGGAIMIGNCPPDPLLDDDGAPLQTPLEFIDDILRCWETSVACGSENDCTGGAPCRCPNTQLQWHTFFWTTGPESTTDDMGKCEGDGTGYCLCWPRLPCGVDVTFFGSFDNFPSFADPSLEGNETFGSDSPLLPNFGLSSIFDVDCGPEFGYETQRIVWYKEQNLIKLVWFNAKDSYLGLRYLSRDWIFSFPKISATVYTLLLVIPLMLLLFGNVRVAVLITIFITAIVFGMPAFSKLVEEQVVPFLVRTENSVFFLSPIWRLLLDWIRFPNHSLANPLGSPSNGEATCFLLNAPAGFFGGTGIVVTLVIILYYFFFISIFFGILAFLFAFLSAPIRVLWNIGACYIFYTDAYDVHLSRRQGYYVESQFTSGGELGPNDTMQEVSRFSPTDVIVSFGKEVRRELSPPTFRDVWNNVWEPLFRQPQAYSGGAGYRPPYVSATIEEIPPQRKDV